MFHESRFKTSSLKKKNKLNVVHRTTQFNTLLEAYGILWKVELTKNIDFNELVMMVKQLKNCSCQP